MITSMGFFGDLLDSFTEKDRWMRRAAGISTLRLICHQDTWLALVSLPSGHIRGSEVEGIDAHDDRIARGGENGMLEIALSGPEVVRIIQVTNFNKKCGEPVRKAIAERTYMAFGSVLDTVGPTHSPDVEIPPVILDDRPPAATS